MTGRRLSRRSLLRAGAALGVYLAAGGCRRPSRPGRRPPGTTPGPSATPGHGPRRAPGSLPHPQLPGGTDSLPQIDHIVVLMLENHSYDNFLGMLRRPGADGLRLGGDARPTASNPYPDGRVQHAFHMPTTCQLDGQPSQAWLDSHIQYDHGRNDGFVRSASGPVAMGYWSDADLPFYYAMAGTFPVADRYFSSLLGQTFPNRRYLLAATSFGQVGDTVPGPRTYPPNGTIMDRLDTHGIAWRNYFSDLPTTGLFPLLVAANPAKVVPVADFFADARGGRLPAFSIVDPHYGGLGVGTSGGTSQESPQDIAAGEAFSAQVVKAVMAGPGWPKTMLVHTYDEHGGYFDHVPPPRAVAPDSIAPEVPGDQRFDGFSRYGFRVPCVVVSAYARPGHVSHVVHDHTSILKLVETKWNLPALTYRDANAADLLDLVDLRSRPAFLDPPALPAPGIAGTGGADLSCTATGPGQIPPPGSVTAGGG